MNAVLVLLITLQYFVMGFSVGLITGGILMGVLRVEPKVARAMSTFAGLLWPITIPVLLAGGIGAGMKFIINEVLTSYSVLKAWYRGADIE